jgi:hypothetical protein
MGAEGGHHSVGTPAVKMFHRQRIQKNLSSIVIYGTVIIKVGFDMKKYTFCRL